MRWDLKGDWDMENENLQTETVQADAGNKRSLFFVLAGILSIAAIAAAAVFALFGGLDMRTTFGDESASEKMVDIFYFFGKGWKELFDTLKTMKDLEMGSTMYTIISFTKMGMCTIVVAIMLIGILITALKALLSLKNGFNNDEFRRLGKYATSAYMFFAVGMLGLLSLNATCMTYGDAGSTGVVLSGMSLTGIIAGGILIAVIWALSILGNLKNLMGARLIECVLLLLQVACLVVIVALISNTILNYGVGNYESGYGFMPHALLLAAVEMGYDNMTYAILGAIMIIALIGMAGEAVNATYKIIADVPMKKRQGKPVSFVTSILFAVCTLLLIAFVAMYNLSLTGVSLKEFFTFFKETIKEKKLLTILILACAAAVMRGIGKLFSKKKKD